MTDPHRGQPISHAGAPLADRPVVAVPVLPQVRPPRGQPPPRPQVRADGDARRGEPVRATQRPHPDPRRARPRLGRERDDAARPAPPERRGRPADDLGAPDEGGVDHVQLRLPIGERERDAVQDHVRAPDPERRPPPQPADEQPLALGAALAVGHPDAREPGEHGVEPDGRVRRDLGLRPRPGRQRERGPRRGERERGRLDEHGAERVGGHALPQGGADGEEGENGEGGGAHGAGRSVGGPERRPTGGAPRSPSSPPRPTPAVGRSPA